VCIIDWENSGPADPRQELACVLFEFARADSGRTRALINAYREAGGPARVYRRGHFSVLIAQLGHITEAAGSDWLNPNSPSPKRADSAWIGEVLDEPHIRELLELFAEVYAPSTLGSFLRAFTHGRTRQLAGASRVFLVELARPSRTLSVNG
jgi:hypothetical protein